MKTAGKIRLLIVDDSVLFRSQIQLALQDSPDIEIVGTAPNGKIALDKMVNLHVDLCTLDIEMPELDGIDTLKEMKARGLKTRAIMFSSQSKAGADRTLEAMKHGALDFVPKPLPDQSKLSPAEKIREALLPKINSIYGLNTPVEAPVPKEKTRPLPFIWSTFNPDILVIASSTGGPNALVEFFTQLREPVPFPIVIAQHMPPIFTASLAERLAVHSGKKAGEAHDGEVLRPNQIYVAPGNYHLSLAGTRTEPVAKLDQGPMRNFVRPCADFLFESASEIFEKNCLGIVFTGMGRDGADGAGAIKRNGGGVIIQTEESCVVFGMPGAVYNEGNFHWSGTPSEIAQKVLSLQKFKRTGHVA